MANQRDLINMLESCGCQRVFSGKNHIKYRLPSGKLFVTAGTPSDHRSYANAFAFACRELRSTHPEIVAAYRPAVAKNKQWRGENPLGEVIAFKPDGAAPPPEEADFEVLDPEPEADELLVYNPPHPPRKEPEQRNGKPKTITADQLAQATRILQAQGEAAMNEYLNTLHSHDQLIEANRRISKERFMGPELVTPKQNEDEGEQLMADVLERARQEYLATVKRIADYETNIEALQNSLEVEINRKNKLEAYIAEHEALANAAIQVLTDLLPPAPLNTKPSLKDAGHSTKGTTKGWIRAAYSIADLRATVLSAMRADGIVQFNTDDALKYLLKSVLPGPHIPRAQLQNWLWLGMQRKSVTTMYVKGDRPGTFRFKDAATPSTEMSETEAPPAAIEEPHPEAAIG
jgi:hypothetical protein